MFRKFDEIFLTRKKFQVKNEIKENVPVALVRSEVSRTEPSSSVQHAVHRKTRFKDSEDGEDAAFSAISDIHISPDLVENPPEPNPAPFLSTAKDFVSFFIFYFLV